LDAAFAIRELHPHSLSFGGPIFENITIGFIRILLVANCLSGNCSKSKSYARDVANGRGYVSIEQAEAIAEELSQCIKANRATLPAPPSYDPMLLDELAKVFAEAALGRLMEEAAASRAAPPAAERHTLETD
jgi:hypothetical protein